MLLAVLEHSLLEFLGLQEISVFETMGAYDLDHSGDKDKQLQSPHLGIKK